MVSIFRFKLYMDFLFEDFFEILYFGITVMDISEPNKETFKKLQDNR